MIATALVPIGDVLHETTARTTWLVASRYLASAVGQPAAGALADRFGARTLLRIGPVLVALGGGIGTFAPSAHARAQPAAPPYVRALRRHVLLGAASGLLRTAQYLGAMASSCVLARVHGARITDDALHHLALIMGIVAIPLGLAVLLDRALRQTPAAAKE